MRKSELTRSGLTGPARCRRESVLGAKCRAAAAVNLTVTSFLSNPDQTLSSTSPLCERHASETEANYRREWEKHPEMFED